MCLLSVFVGIFAAIANKADTRSIIPFQEFFVSTARFGVSIDESLLRKLDRLIEEKGYANRSEAVRDLMRDALAERQWSQEDGETVGTVTLV